MTRVGVTGHRLLRDPRPLEAAVDQALDEIQEAFADHTLVILSALAEGADRLVARRALARSGAQRPSLVACLPRPQAEYVSDFHGEASVAEFEELLSRAAEVVELSPAGAPRDQGYRAVADYLLANSHVLVALWDGGPATNDVGTAAVVERARHGGLPIAWVQTQRDPSPADEAITTRHGDLVLERLR